MVKKRLKKKIKCKKKMFILAVKYYENCSCDRYLLYPFKTMKDLRSCLKIMQSHDPDIEYMIGTGSV